MVTCAAPMDFSVDERLADAATLPAHYVRGRYSPKRESGVHHFPRLWSAAMERVPPEN